MDFGTWESVGRAIDTAGAALFLVLALAMVFVRPRTKQTWAFAGFAFSMGALFTISNALRETLPPEWLTGLEVAFATSFGVISTALVFIFPSRAVQPGRLVSTSAAAFVVMFGPAVYKILTGAVIVSQVTAVAHWLVAFGGAVALVAGSAMRYASTRTEVERGRIRVLALALLPWLSWTFGTFWWHTAVDVGARGILSAFAVSFAAAAVVAPSAWLIAAARTPDDRAPRLLAVYGLAWAAIALLTASLLDHPGVLDLGFAGVLRAGGFALFAYAIIRRDMFDLEVRLKWTVSRGTVAAIILTAAFVVTEAATQFFGDRTGSAYLGIAAAGLLVFAIAPLQRFGDRIAERAMPGVRPIAERSVGERADIYADLVRSAWEDGQLSPAERRVLEKARERLSLSADQALAAEKTALA